MTDYISVKIPMVLANKIKNVMYELGFTSVTGFILDATRRLLREIQQQKEKLIQKCRWNEHNFKPIIQCITCNSIIKLKDNA